MKLKTVLFATILIWIGCNNQSTKTNAQVNNVNYESYYNTRYDFGVDYPDFLIPKGESDSEDGQEFISEDKLVKMLAYREFKAITGENPTLKEAFNDDLKDKNITKKELSESSYLIVGKLDKQKMFRKYTIFANDDFYVLYFEYPENQDKKIEVIAEQVSNSFNVGMANSDENEFVMLLGNFLNNCYFNVNFNKLLRDKSSKLEPFLDSKMDVRRYYNPGSVAYLYSRDKKFGFDEYSDFTSTPSHGGRLAFSKVFEDLSPCEIDFEADKGTVYYYQVDELPDEITNSETLETRKVTTPYPNAPIMLVLMPNEHYNPRGFYFVQTPNGWKLAFVDDSFCSA